MNDTKPPPGARAPDPVRSPAHQIRLETRLSIIVPFFNEEESVRPVLAEILGLYPQAELIAVDDGSTDNTLKSLEATPGLRLVRFSENQGQSAAILAGLRNSTRSYCAILDGDGQNDPRDLIRLAEHLVSTQCDVVCGFRADRQDTRSRRIASAIANRIRRFIVSDGIRDTGCSLKVFRREAVDCLIPFNGMHRYLPAFFRAAGYRIEEIPVNHRPRERGASKYTNWDRALRGIYDLFGVRWFLTRRVDPAKARATETKSLESL